jgi:diadenosine tetraphosphate (Ap4A) HIT family hydrolase
LDSCSFCNLPNTRIKLETPHALVVEDGFPVSEGHTLVIPRRHVSSLYELKKEEQEAVWRVVAEVRAGLLARLPYSLPILVASGQCYVHVQFRRSLP